MYLTANQHMNSPVPNQQNQIASLVVTLFARRYGDSSNMCACASVRTNDDDLKVSVYMK